MAARRPIIASDVPFPAGSPGAGGARGFLVPPDDGGALQDAILALRARPELAEELAARGRASAGPWTWDHRARRVLETFAPHLPHLRRRWRP